MLKVLLALLKGPFGAMIVAAIRELLKMFAQDPGYLDKLSKLAAEKVAEAEAKYKGAVNTGDVKYQEVFAALVAWAQGEGLEVSKRAINFAIEAALLALPE